MKTIMMSRWLSLLLFLLAGVAVSAQSVVSDARASERQYNILFNEAMLQRQKHHHDATFDLLTRCLELKPDASEVYFFLAQYYTEIKDADKALSFFKKAAELCPDNMTYLETLAQSYISKEMYAESIPVVEKMYESDKSRQELLEMLYRLYIQEKDFEKAISVLERMETIDGKSERLSLAKSSLYIQMGDHEHAIASIRALSEEHPYDLNYRTLYANTLMANEEFEEGYQVLLQVLEEEPDNARAQQSLRSYYIRMEDVEAADSITRRILTNRHTETDAKITMLRQLIAENEANGGDSTEVLTIFDEMLQQPEPDADIAELKAVYMDLKQMPRDSIAHALEKVLSIDPARAASRLHLVQYAWEAEDNDRIVELCQAARQYNPEEMAFYYYQGMAYYRQDDTDHALEAFQNGINVINDQSSPEIVSDFYAVMGDLLYQKDREREAFAAYDSCLQWKPDNIGCLNNYAYYLSLKGTSLDKAEEMSYKTIKAEPKNATYLDTYAWILFMQGRYAEARIYIDQALQNDSAIGAVVTEHAGDIYAMAGDVDGAIGLWQKALAADPTNKLLARKIKRKKYIKQ